jgi:ABC-type sugar transport system permease subunit
MSDPTIISAAITPTRPLADHRLESTLDRWAGLLLTSPALVIIVALMLYPLLYAIWLSFVQWKPASSTFVGLDNYVRLFADRLFWVGLSNTVFYTAWNLVAGTAMALGLALLMNRPGILARILRLAVFFPVIISSAVAALAWIWMFNSDFGLLNVLLVGSGLTDTGLPWLNSPHYAKWSIVIVNLWLGAGISSMLFLAALQNVPVDQHEAAVLDGANRWHRFVYITLPYIRPTLLVVMTLKLIGSFKTFDQIFIMTGGGPLYTTETVLMYLYRHGFEYFDFGYAGAIGVVFFLLVSALSIAQALVLRGGAK